MTQLNTSTITSGTKTVIDTGTVIDAGAAQSVATLKQSILEKVAIKNICDEDFIGIAQTNTLEDFAAMIAANPDYVLRNLGTAERIEAEIPQAMREAAGIFTSGEAEVIDRKVTACGTVKLTLTGNGKGDAYDTSHIAAGGNSTVRLFGKSSGEASGSTAVKAREGSTVILNDTCRGDIYDNATAEGYNDSHINARGKSRATGYGNTKMRGSEYATLEGLGNTEIEDARGNAFVRLYDKATIARMQGCVIVDNYTDSEVLPQGGAIVVDRKRKRIYVSKGAYELVEIQ